MTTRQEVARMAAQLGHTGIRIETSGARYRWLCDCGHKSNWRNTMAIAVESAQFHLVKAVREFRPNGVSLPDKLAGAL